MPRACVAEAGRADPAFVVRSARPSWQLTDRGIALVLVVAAMVVMAALAVVVPTALRVTGDHYQPVGTSQLAQP